MKNVSLGGTKADGTRGKQIKNRFGRESCINKNDSVFVTTEKDFSAHQDVSLILWFLNDEERKRELVTEAALLY